MKGAAYKKALKAVGLSISAAGPFLGFTRRQSFRIAAGDVDVPEAARKLLIIMSAQGWTAQNLETVDSRLAPR